MPCTNLKEDVCTCTTIKHLFGVDHECFFIDNESECRFYADPKIIKCGLCACLECKRSACYVKDAFNKVCEECKKQNLKPVTKQKCPNFIK